MPKIEKQSNEEGANKQEAAESILNPRTVDYYGAASLDAYTLAENRSSFRKCRLLPRVMRDVSSIRPQTTIFGCESALPIYVSPASNALLGHPEGELNITRGVSSSQTRLPQFREAND
jgi:L-lactate dehydrogenase (cytochrome)